MQIKPSTIALVLFIGTVLLVVLTFSGGDSDSKRTHHFRDPPVIPENEEKGEEEEEEEAETNTDQEPGSDDGNLKGPTDDDQEADNTAVSEDKEPDDSNKDPSDSEQSNGNTNESDKPDTEDSDKSSEEQGQDLDGDKDSDGSDENTQDQGQDLDGDEDNDSDGETNSVDDTKVTGDKDENEQETPDDVKSETGGSTTGDVNVAYDDDEDSDDEATSTVPATTTTTTATTTTPAPTTVAPTTTTASKPRKRKAFFDIGARAGDATVAFLNEPEGGGSNEMISGLGSFGVEWDIWIFEASPVYTDRLIKLADRLKTDPRLTVFLRNETAICPENGTKKVQYDQPGCTNCTKVVPCVSLSEVLARYSKEDAVLLKIDAPCAEVQLLIESLKASDSLSLVDAWAVRWAPPCAEEDKLEALKKLLTKAKARILEWKQAAI